MELEEERKDGLQPATCKAHILQIMKEAGRPLTRLEIGQALVAAGGPWTRLTVEKGLLHLVRPGKLIKLKGEPVRYQLAPGSEDDEGPSADYYGRPTSSYPTLIVEAIHQAGKPLTSKEIALAVGGANEEETLGIVRRWLRALVRGGQLVKLLHPPRPKSVRSGYPPRYRLP